MDKKEGMKDFWKNIKTAFKMTVEQMRPMIKNLIGIICLGIGCYIISEFFTPIQAIGLALVFSGVMVVKNK